MTPACKLMHYSIPEPNSGCWIWLGGTCPSGHALVRIDGKMRRANRVALETRLERPILPGLMALHRCIGMPSCVNPDHLYEGTAWQNVDDTISQNRRVIRRVVRRS